MYTHIHIYLQLSSFWFCLDLPPQSLAEARSLPSFQFPMCKYNSISSGGWRGAEVSRYSLVVICLPVRPGFQSPCRSSFLNLTKPVSAADTSRLLHHAPWLPRVELVVGRLQHLFYMTHQLKSTARHVRTRHRQLTRAPLQCLRLP